MNLYQIFLVSLTGSVGITTIISETRENKVSNAWILTSLGGGLALTAFFALAGWFGRTQLISNRDIIVYMINLTLVFAGGFSLWKFDRLDAGIAKLTILYAALIPVTLIERTYLSFFPALVFIVNTCLLIGLYLVGEFVFFWLRILFSARYRQTINWRPMQRIDKSVNINSWANYVWMLVVFLVILELARSVRFFLVDSLKTSSTDWFILATLGLFLARRQARKFMQRKVFLTVGVVTAMFLWRRSVTLGEKISWLPIIEVISVILLVMFVQRVAFKKALRVFVANVWRKKIPMVELIWPMTPVDFFWKKIQQDSNEKEKEMLQGIEYDNMTPAETLWVRNLAIRLNIENIKIQKKFPIAVWMFFGAVATIVARGPIIDIVFKYFWK